MKKPSRTCGVLTISVFAVVTAACSSSTDASTGGPAVSAKASYCAPLAAAQKLRPPPGQTSVEPMKPYARALEPAAAAASADGKPEVAGWLRLHAKTILDPTHLADGDLQKSIEDLKKVNPIMVKDCGFTSPK